MDTATTSHTTMSLPYDIVHLETPTEMKLSLSHDDFCFIVKETTKGAGIYWGKELQFTALSLNDLVIIPAGLHYGLSAGLKLVTFKSTRPQYEALHQDTPLGPKIYPFEQIHSSYFFSHSDFSLQKINKDQILCLSLKSELSLMLNLDNKEMKVFGN